MRDELLDKTALVTSIYDQMAADAEAKGDHEAAEAARKLADSAAEAGSTLRRLLEKHGKRVNLLDEFAYKFECDNGRFPTPEEQVEEMKRLGYMSEDGEWIV